MVILLADRLVRMVAPANAPHEEGGIGVQTSSQISTCARTRAGRRLQKSGHSQKAHPGPGAETRARRIEPGSKLPLLVELAVSWQIAFGDDAEDSTTMNHHRTIEQLGFKPERRTDDEHGPE